MLQDKNDNITNFGSNETTGKRKRSVFKKTALILISLLVLALIFNLGMFIINVKKDRWTKEQHFGKIIEMNDSNFTIQGRSDEKKKILISRDTVIKRGNETVKNTLQVGDEVIVFGRLNEEGRIESRFIRVFDQKDYRNPKYLLPDFLR